MSRRTPWRALTIAVAAAWTTQPHAGAQLMPTTTAPDLRLEWIVADGDKERPQNELTPPAPTGLAEETVRLKYRIRDVGSTDALAVTVRVQTVRVDDPRDPFTEDNRICRRATVRPARARQP